MNEIQKTNTSVQMFKYNGTGITFNVGDNLMVNATEMAKSFNKRPVEWFRLPSTNDFLMAFIRDYEKNRGEKISLRYAEISLREIMEILSMYNLVIIQQGGNLQGTWISDEIAIEFARWLSPDFSIWCNKRIKEILNGGSKYPMTSDEAIAYGYGKALEKINRQSTIIARQGKQLQKLKSRLESEKEAKRLRLTLASETKDEDVARWLSESGIKGVLSLSSLFVNYSAFCEKHGISYDNKKKLSSALRNLGFTDIRRAQGICFII